MQINVTTAHIHAAKPYPYSSPIALALREMGYTEVSVNHRFASVDGTAYRLPEIASQNEIYFDFCFNQGEIQGELLRELKPYQFELGED